MPLSLEALEKRRAKLGPDHPETVISIHNLAGVYNELGKFDLAVPLFEEAYAKFKALLGSDHPDTLIGMCNVALAYTRTKRYEEAERLALEYLGHRKPDRPADTVALTLLADCQVALKKFTAAEASLREVLTASAKLQPKAVQHRIRFDAESRFSAALAGQGKFKEAEALAISGYQGLKAMEDELTPKARRTVVEALERIVQLYEKWPKPDEAAKWRRLLEVRK